MATSAMLSGRHAVVTGARCGINATIAAQLAAQGATLTLMGRDTNVLQAIAKMLSDSARAQVVTCDMTDGTSVAATFESARVGSGPTSILINSAGQAKSVPFAKTTLDRWQHMLSVSLTGTFLRTQATLTDVQTSGRGRVVNVTSTTGQRDYAYVSACVTAKHGVIGLTRSLVLELAMHDATVNAVCSGYTKTDIMRKSIDRTVARTSRNAEEALVELVKGNPQGRFITPDEVAGTMVWLYFDNASSVTGQAISTSGGEVM